MPKKKNVVVLGGGTGTYTVLLGLKKHKLNLSAVVSMADDGGSTGILRDELGVLPPGDVRQCLVALSRSDLLMRKLMNYRFANGGLKGHSFGNILLSALEKVGGDFGTAVDKASDILRLDGKVIPATLEKARIVAYTNNHVVRGESALHTANLKKLKKIVLQPRVKANKKAIRAIKEANIIVIGPGSFYSSLVPVLLIDGIAKAICKSKAKKVYICNLMTMAKHTEKWNVKKFTEQMERYLGCSLDTVIYNNKRPPAMLVRKYALKKEKPVKVEKELPKDKFLGADLLNKKFPEVQKNDRIKRSLIRHNPERLAKLILKVFEKR